VPHFEVLDSELRKFEIDLPPEQKRTLARYCDELVHWNKKINLTGLSGPDLVRRLVVEPVWIGLQLKPHGVLADIGAGNGSPGIPLQVVCHFQKVHLIEVRVRKAAFLRYVIAALELREVVVHRSRFESVVSELKPVDWITLQGVAPDRRLVDSMKQIASATTNIVWITSADVEVPMNPAFRLHVPLTETEVYVFRGF
jgi:16S rRNA (guanine(527)-N(7))-methyltransferase RsmG